MAVTDQSIKEFNTKLQEDWKSKQRDKSLNEWVADHLKGRFGECDPVCKQKKLEPTSIEGIQDILYLSAFGYNEEDIFDVFTSLIEYATKEDRQDYKIFFEQQKQYFTPFFARNWFLHSIPFNYVSRKQRGMLPQQFPKLPKEEQQKYLNLKHVLAQKITNNDFKKAVLEWIQSSLDKLDTDATASSSSAETKTMLDTKQTEETKKTQEFYHLNGMEEIAAQLHKKMAENIARFDANKGEKASLEDYAVQIIIENLVENKFITLRQYNIFEKYKDFFKNDYPTSTTCGLLENVFSALSPVASSKKEQTVEGAGAGAPVIFQGAGVGAGRASLTGSFSEASASGGDEKAKPVECKKQ